MPSSSALCDVTNICDNQSGRGKTVKAPVAFPLHSVSLPNANNFLPASTRLDCCGHVRSRSATFPSPRRRISHFSKAARGWFSFILLTEMQKGGNYSSIIFNYFKKTGHRSTAGEVALTSGINHRLQEKINQCKRQHFAVAAAFRGDFSAPDSASQALGWRLKGHRVPQR